MSLYEEIGKCFSCIEKHLSANDLLIFKNTCMSKLCMYHFSLGLWIRNNFLHPEQNPLRLLFIENGIDNPDEMSSIIIALFHYYISLS